VRGAVPSSSSTLYVRSLAWSLETSELGSVSDPKTIAFDGHACWHAVVTAPSAMGTPSILAWISDSRIRWTQ